MEHPKEAVEAVALALCHIMHGHENIDDLGLLPRQLLMRRADMICNLVEPHYRERAAQQIERDCWPTFGDSRRIAAAIRKGE